MTRSFLARAGLAAMLAAFAVDGRAEVLSRSGTFGDLEVEYRVVLPDNYDPESSHPAILHFAGGPQTMRIVGRSLASDWQALAEQRGYIVVSPASPNGELYFEGADRIFPEFIERILADYNVAGGRLHVTGHSNGGLSAFHIASLYPEYFLSVTGYPGLLDPREAGRLEALRPLCIYMHVGEKDPGWLSIMRDQAALLDREGFDVHFEIELGQTHRLDTRQADLAQRLFAELGSATTGCQTAGDGARR
jgi:dipeptidyl aminopeptidase/acylaminoacyl peptidase